MIGDPSQCAPSNPDPPAPVSQPPPGAKPPWVFPHPFVVDALEQAVELGLPLKDACALAGTTLPTFKAWERRAAAGDAVYAEVIQEIGRHRAIGMQACLQKITAAKEWQAQAWKLGKIAPQDFGKQADLAPVTNDPEVLRRNYGGLAALALEFIPAARIAEYLNRVEAQIAAIVGGGVPGQDERAGATGDEQGDGAGGVNGGGAGVVADG
jgi:hypothetical protein